MHHEPLPAGWPAHHSDGTGHALFATRLGVCGVAWGAWGLVALQLPETDGPQATRERMLRTARQRRPGEYVGAVSRAGAAPAWAAPAWAALAGALPQNVAQAIAGVQTLMAGHGDWTWQACDSGSDAVLPDLRPERCLPAGMPLPDLAHLVLDWHGVSAFHRRVYALTRAIAPGHTRSYGEIARELGDVGLSRAVGQALGLNPFAPVIPCHRVLAAGGEPGGFSGGAGALTKLRMLEIEGAAWGGTCSLFGD